MLSLPHRFKAPSAILRHQYANARDGGNNPTGRGAMKTQGAAICTPAPIC